MLAFRTLISIIRRDRHEISNLREAGRQAGRQTDGQTSASIQVDVTGNPPPAPQLPLVNVPHKNYSNEFKVCKSAHQMQGGMTVPLKGRKSSNVWETC
jgi:hypothetical protein